MSKDSRPEKLNSHFDPAKHGRRLYGCLARPPTFLAIVAASSLATTLARKANGRVDGFVVEGHTAGGHNAPPRGKTQLTETGEPLPVRRQRDVVDLEKGPRTRARFWLAGGTGSPATPEGARQVGAAGIQVGTLFAYCDESGFT